MPRRGSSHSLSSWLRSSSSRTASESDPAFAPLAAVKSFVEGNFGKMKTKGLLPGPPNSSRESIDSTSVHSGSGSGSEDATYLPS